MTDRKLRGWVEDLLVVAATGLFAAELCFVAPTVFESCDYVMMWKPIWHFFVQALREGSFPIWNPYIGLGRPFLADIQNAVFYPPVYLICLGQKLGVFILIWLHCVIAVLGMRRLGEALAVGKAQSYFMALCFTGSGALTARWVTGQLPYCWALCYVPWLFYYAVRTGEPWNIRRAAWYALVLALQFLCGNPQVFWFSTIGQGVFVLGRAIKFPARAAATDLMRSGGQFGLALAWSMGLVAMELLPFSELVKQGNRNAPSPAFANFLKLQLEHFGTLVTPVGFSAEHAPHFWEMNLFVGVLVLVLGVAGLCRVREPNVRGLLAVLVIGLLLALGDATPAFALFYHWLPGFASLRVHAREAFLAVFALTCAAGICLSRPHPKLQEVCGRFSKIPMRHLFIGLVLIQTLDLIRADRQMQNTYTFANTFHHPPESAFQRVLVEQLQKNGLMQKGAPPPRVCVPEFLLPQNNAMIYGYGNFDANFSLFLRRDWDYLHRMLGLQPSEFINTHVADAVYGHGPFPYPDVALSAGFDPASGALYIQTNTSPRAFVVYAAEVVPDYDEMLARLAKGHDIHKSALLEQPLATLSSSSNGPTATLAHISQFETGSMLVDVNAKTNGLLVLAEAWYPGWRAEVDGRTYECAPVNTWMRGVPVEAGDHEVRVFFHQNHLFAGLVVSAMSVGLLIFVLVWTSGQSIRGRAFKRIAGEDAAR